MTKDEEGYIVGLLLPLPKYSGCWYDNSIVWEDERPYPSQEEIDERYLEYITAKNKKENNKKVWEDHDKLLAEGFVYTDGVRYRCDANATIDIVKILILYDLDPKDIVYSSTYDNTPTEMSIDDFKLLSIEIGKYQYLRRQELWNNLI